MRLLIIIAIFYLAYRALKVWFRRNIVEGSGAPERPSAQIDDEMVKDPVCEMYFPKNSGVSLNIDGKTLYFCGKECKEKYLSDRTENK